MDIKLGKIPVKIPQHDYGTRTKDYTYQAPRCSKSVGQRSHAYLAPKIFNIIPEHLKEEKSIRLFKKRLKMWLNGETRSIISNVINKK